MPIRRAAAADLDAIAAFLQPFVQRQEVLGRTADELAFLLTTSFVATGDDGLIVGFCTLEIYSHKLAEVRSLAVDDRARGHGLGQQLVEACVALAREKQIREVMAITAAEGLFARVGFDAALPNQKKALFLQTGDE